MKSKFIKILNLFFVVILCLSVTACSEKPAGNGAATGQPGASNEQKNDKVIKLGTLSTIEPFVTVLKDELVAKGYNAEVVMFDANNMPAIATKDGDIDGYIHNHLPWIETFNKENNSKLKVMEPHLFYYRFAVYSSKHKSIEDFPNGAQIAIPNDPVNVNLSLMMLQNQGLLTLGEKTEAFYTVLDIKDNPKNIKILETEITTTARSIDDADAVFCPATRIKAAGIDPNSFLVEDTSAVNYPVGLTVNEGTENEQWVKDAMEILSSEKVKAKFDEIFNGTLVRY